MFRFLATRRAKLLIAHATLIVAQTPVLAVGRAPEVVATRATILAWDAEQWLYEAARAAGASAEQATAGVSRYRNFVAELQLRLRSGEDLIARAQAVLDFLHGRVLTGPFSPSASNVALALDGGAYNCLTASMLYVALAAEVGLDAQAHCTTGHVWCQLRQDSTTLWVETTSRHGMIEVQPANPRGSATFQIGDSNELSQRALVGLVDYNRGVQLHRAGRLDEAAAAYRRALALAPKCREARCNLLAVIGSQWFCRFQNVRRLAVEKLSLTACHF